MKGKTIKFLDTNIRENIYDLEYGDDFLDITPEGWSMKEITGNLDFFKVKELLLCERCCQENEKTSHRQIENICQKKKTYIK